MIEKYFCKNLSCKCDESNPEWVCCFSCDNKQKCTDKGLICSIIDYGAKQASDCPHAQVETK